MWNLNFTVKTYLFGPVTASKDIRKVTLDYRTDIVMRPAELRYSAPVSTENPPVPREEIDPSKEGSYKVIETYQEIYSDDNDFFSLS